MKYNFQTLRIGAPQYPLRDNWREYTNIKVGVIDEAPEEIKQIGAERLPMMTLVADPGIKYRFKAEDLATNGLSIDKVNIILSQFAIKRGTTDFLYYTGQNPLVLHPIVDLENGLYQVFEEKRVLHAILYKLDEICKEKDKSKARLTHSKGHYLEDKIENLFRKSFGKKAEIINNYVIDGCEQDIIVLWNGHMFVIEAKAYTNREPFRNADKAFTRIKDDFNSCIGYAYKQCKRIENKMKAGKPFDLLDKNGNVIKTINPADYDGNDFYIIVNQESFGQIQVDLSMFLQVGEGENYPWAIRFDDIEVFLLTLIAKKKKPQYLVDFLIMREYLHGHIICSDECEICGGYLTGKLTQDMAEGDDIITTAPDLASVFDDQYRKGMGFEKEKHWKEKHAIIDHLQTFIMELGKGYAFVARQQHIKTDMGDFYIDLVFYNIILKSYLIIDLKTTQITHQDVGQMDMYVRMYDELKKEEGNNPTIGLVLCSDTSKDLARYSILKDSKQLFAAKYLTYLPTEEELSREIREQKEFFELQKGKEVEDED